MPSADDILVWILLDTFDGLLGVLKLRTFFDLVLIAATIALIIQENKKEQLHKFMLSSKKVNL